MPKTSTQNAGRAALGITGLVILIALLAPKRATVYQGQSIEEWFAGLTSESEATRNRAEEAFAALGTDCLPYLLSQVEAGKPTTKEHLQSWVEANILRRPQIVRCGLGLVGESDSQNARLVRAFEIIGERATPVVPKLGSLLSDPRCAYEAATSLMAIGPASLHQLERAIKDDNVEIRRTVASAFGGARFARTNSASLLMGAMKDTDALVRHYAAHSLGQLGQLPMESVAALIAALEDSDSRVRYISIYALRKFGADALPALPMLGKLEYDQEESVRKGAAQVAHELTSSFPPAPDNK